MRVTYRTGGYAVFASPPSQTAARGLGDHSSETLGFSVWEVLPDVGVQCGGFKAVGSMFFRYSGNTAQSPDI